VSASPALDAMGWHPTYAGAFESHEAAGRVAARVIAEERGHFVVHDGVVTLAATVSGRLRHESGGDPLAYPAVGDWVAATVGAVLFALHPAHPESVAFILGRTDVICGAFLFASLWAAARMSRRRSGSAAPRRG